MVAHHARQLLLSRAGFTDDLTATSHGRDDVALIDTARRTAAADNPP